LSALFYFREKDVTNVIAESIQKARVAMSKRAFGESKALLDEVLSAEPDNFEGRYTLAVLHRAEGQPANAKVLLETLVAEKPDFGRGFQGTRLMRVGA
jgi:thioredoxin-like negative regulator of GroEL